ncbi:GNAT family N-acetyltransferase [Aliarcobacter lanthieri]|uniref:GNAT family N-acetyltransferase n=1 Tax=Aliarcobacter lanthieri TaxID=1355374 RepID=UPI003AA9268E
MNLETERLYIRKFKSTDWEEVYEYTSNPDVMYYLPEKPFTQEDAKKFMQDNEDKKAEKLAILLKNSNKLIGHIVFFPYFGDHTYEIGWVFNPKYYNQGYATEAAKAILDYGFKIYKLHRIIATCQPENKASWHIMEKLNMRREGFFKKCIPTKFGWWDEYYYSILAEEYIY